MQNVGCITTFVQSINATRGWNENGRFSARLRLAKLMPGRDVKSKMSFISDIPKFLKKENTWRFYLYRGLLICKSRANLIFQVLPDYV